MSKGYVYILSNPAMPGAVKIGRTTKTPDRRAAQLSGTSVPLAFKLEAFVFAPDCVQLECSMHEAFGSARINGGREFFAVTAHDARNMLERLHYQQVSEWLEEFLPDHTAVRPECFPDEGCIGYLAARLDEHPFVLAEAMNDLTPEEVKPVLDRYYAKRAQAKWGALQ
jgi:hypothetical protein